MIEDPVARQSFRIPKGANKNQSKSFTDPHTSAQKPSTHTLTNSNQNEEKMPDSSARIAENTNSTIKSPLLSRPQAAEYLGIKDRHLDNLRKDGDLRATTFRSRILYRKDVLDAYIEAHTERPKGSGLGTEVTKASEPDVHGQGTPDRDQKSRGTANPNSKERDDLAAGPRDAA